MGGRVVPEDYWSKEPAWRNLTENESAVQFNHRYLGMTTATVCTAIAFYAHRFTLPGRLLMAAKLYDPVAVVCWCLSMTLGRHGKDGCTRLFKCLGG